MSNLTFDSVIQVVQRLPLLERRRLQEWLAKEGSLPTAQPSTRLQQELQWLAVHRAEYRGQWVVLDGNRLIAAAPTAPEAFAAADASAVELPLVIRVEEADELPFGGW